MSKRFDYQVWQMQLRRVTFVDGEWQGSVPRDGAEGATALESCPLIWDLLRERGALGWELVSVFNRPEEHGGVQTLFLKRELE